MKKIGFLLFIFTFLYANIDIKSFQSSFIQKITNDQNKTITYKGQLYFKAPLLVKWIYQEPIQKAIHIIANKVVIIEPDLEQVVITKVYDEKNILKLLKEAKEVEKDHYKAIYKEQTIDIFLKNSKLYKIEYKDELGNNNQIIFLNPKQNTPLPNSLFQYHIDPEFDVIYK